MIKRPFLIIIDGPMGSGKSTTAKELHKKMKRTAILSLDRIKHLLSDFRRQNNKDLQLASDIGIAMAREYLKKGINVIVEKALTKKEYVNQFIKIAKNRAHILVYQIEAPLEIRIERIRERPVPLDVRTKKRPSMEKIKRNSKNYNEFKYRKARVFDSFVLTTSQIVREVLKDVKSISAQKQD